MFWTMLLSSPTIRLPPAGTGVAMVMGSAWQGPKVHYPATKLQAKNEQYIVILPRKFHGKVCTKLVLVGIVMWRLALAALF